MFRKTTFPMSRARIAGVSVLKALGGGSYYRSPPVAELNHSEARREGGRYDCGATLEWRPAGAL